MARRKRYFVLMDGNGKERGVFSGRQPRQAALKVANRGVTNIRLRERGTKKIHIYKGTRVQVAAPPNAPKWMGSRVWKPKVKKGGIEKIGHHKK